MGIPQGKIDLYISAGGFSPSRSLPIVMDLGTNTQKYIKGDSYLGIKGKKLSSSIDLILFSMILFYFFFFFFFFLL